MHLVDGVGRISLAKLSLIEDPSDEERIDEGEFYNPMCVGVMACNGLYVGSSYWNHSAQLGQNWKWFSFQTPRCVRAWAARAASATWARPAGAGWVVVEEQGRWSGGTHILRFFMLRLPVHRNTIVQVTKIKNTFLSEFLFIRILNFPSTFLLELLFYPNFIVQKISLLERFLVILKNKQMFTITRFVFSQMTLLFTISIFTE